MPRRVLSPNLTTLCLLMAAGCAAPQTLQSPAVTQSAAVLDEGGDKLSRAETALEAGRFEEAEQALSSALKSEDSGVRARAVLLQARLEIERGAFEEAGSLLHGAQGPEATLLRSRLLIDQGKWQEAQAVLSVPLDNWSSLERMQLRLTEAQLHLLSGQRKSAIESLQQVVVIFEGAEGLQEREKRRALTLAGKAAAALRDPRTANDFYNRAELAGDADVELLLARGHLYLSNHDLAHAGQVSAEALERAPGRPDVLVLHAEIRLAQALSFVEAEELALKALRQNPKHRRARYVLAGIALRDLEVEAAEEHCSRGLEHNPRDLDLLAMQAAASFLAEKRGLFDSRIEHILALSPGYARALEIVAEYAEWEHRYSDIEKLLRRASRLDREAGSVRGRLGLTLVRAGSDAAGVVELRRAYQLDPFDVRVVNTLKLYEDIIPKRYDESRDGPFVVRTPKDETALLQRYIPPLLQRAHRAMVERYGYSPKAPLKIELYATHEQFAVRTGGLPRTAIAGVCFGRKIATMSPAASQGNLGMTLWHELAHVFHIGLSQSRVPRWLTEGLAEWETEVLDRGWSRELDQELHGALVAETLPRLGSMSRAFTRARRMQDVAVAYYASGKIAAWIAETRGEEAVLQILQRLGKKELPSEVVPAVLGASFQDLDVEFRRWLEQKLAHFETQFVRLPSGRTVAEARDALQQAPGDRAAELALALALFDAGDVQSAVPQLERAVAEDFDSQAAWRLSQAALADGEKQEARRWLERLREAGEDGYQIRLILARLALIEARKDPAAYSVALTHLREARRFDPTATEPYELTAAIARTRKDLALELEVTRAWAFRSEHDSSVHRRLLQLLLQSGDAHGAAAAADNAIWAGLGSAETHELAGRAHAAAGNSKQADFEWESSLLSLPSGSRRDEQLQRWMQELQSTGRSRRAASAEKRWSSQ